VEGDQLGEWHAAVGPVALSALSFQDDAWTIAHLRQLIDHRRGGVAGARFDLGDQAWRDTARMGDLSLGEWAT
jgi:hypothetical protein